ncbi:MAG: SelB C-terminal domain-containing protein, partial [Gemmatimonadota bacterium]|nr:SelB C-terminal domain-containing protein [Gemmatimonadota bacterium]
GTGDLPMRAVVDFLERESAIVRVGRDRYLDAGIIQEIVRHAREALGASGELGPAQLRDRLGLTRKFSIPLLEWLDGQGFTVRRGDVRIAGPRLTGRPAES